MIEFLYKYGIAIGLVVLLVASSFFAGSSYGGAIATAKYSVVVSEKDKKYEELLKVLNTQTNALSHVYERSEASKAAWQTTEARLRTTIKKNQQQASQVMGIKSTSCLETLKKVQEVK